MKFLKAKKIVRESDIESVTHCVLYGSAQLENLSPFIEAHGILCGLNAKVRYLPFGTLQQELVSATDRSELPLACLFPWDFCPAIDWRRYSGETEVTLDLLTNEVEQFYKTLQPVRCGGVFVEACIPPVLPVEQQRTLSRLITSYAVRMGLTCIPNRVFSLASYLEYGRPLDNSAVSDVAEAIISSLIRQSSSINPKKVILTDLDNTAWHGVVGEVGADHVACEASGAGFPHFIYQTFLKRCVRAGVVLVAVSKNDLDLARAPFQKRSFPLTEADFVSFKVGYGRKSALIQQVSEELNLPCNSFIFIDDNPIEIAEVSTALPEVECFAFPEDVNTLPSLLNQLEQQMNLGMATDEDKSRTELYKLKQQAEETKAGFASLDEYLASLQMQLMVQEVGEGNISRVVQLINKTNQFNLNGIRITEQALEKTLEQGGRAVCFSLSDKFGDHGIIAACVVNRRFQMSHWVMSCRVFQRKVEHAILYWLLHQSAIRVKGLQFIKTERNSPVEHFLNDLELVSANSLDLDDSVVTDRVRTELKEASNGLFNIVPDSTE